MDFGLGILGYTGCWEDVAFAEQHGFATAGFVDSPLLGGDPFVCMGLAAAVTSRIRLGTFLAVPGNRSAATTAAAIATVNRLAPGRVFLGMGTGNTSRNVFGLRPLAAGQLAAYARDCRTLLDGGEAHVPHGDSTSPYRFTHQADRHAGTGSHIPVYLAGDGPKALAAIGENADGWITTMQYSHMMDTSPGVFAASRAAIEQAATGAGRVWTDRYCMLSTAMCILEDGEDATSPRVLELVGAMAMLPFHSYADNPAIAEHLPPPIQDRLDVYQRDVLAKFPDGADRRHQWTHRGHLSHLLPGEAGVLTEELIRMVTLTGTLDEVTTTLRRLEVAGLRNVSLWVPPQLTRQTVLDIERRVMPTLAGVPAVPAS